MTDATPSALQNPVASFPSDVLSPLYGVSPEDRDPQVDEMVARYEPYIRTHVKRKATTYHIQAHPETLDLELDDIVENVLVGFWQKLRAGVIHYPEAYIQRMIDYAFLDILRLQKRQGMPLPLSMTFDDDQSRISALEICDETALDPETDVVQQESARDLAAQLARAISHLPPRQKLAIECALHEHLADFAQLNAVFIAWHVSIENARWPGTEEEKHRLKASLSAARCTLAHALHIDLSTFKRKGASRLP